MTVSLGGITLSDHLVLNGLDEAPGIAWSSRRTIGGAAKTQKQTVTGGRTFELNSEYHITYANMIAIKAKENAGAAVALVHPRLTCNVLIIGVSLEPDTELSNPASATDLWYSGTIKLLEV